MVTEYESQYVAPQYSFSGYQSYMKIDPVLRFVGFCIKKGEDQSQSEYQAIIDYVTRLFYSVRGTRRVFDYISRYLGIKFIGNPVYTVKTISFSIQNDTTWYDVSLFNSYLLEFLECLLYYESISYKVDLNLDIQETKDFYSGVKIMTYKVYKI